MALWIMGFGGTVPIGNLIAGPLIEATSVTTVVLGGAVVALGLAAYADLEAPTEVARPRPPPTPTEPRASEDAAARRSRPATRLPLTRTASPSPSVAEAPRAPRRSSATSSPP